MAAPRKPRSTATKSGSGGTGRGRSATRGGTGTRGAARSTQSSSNQDTPERDGQGRFKPDHTVRNAAFGATAALGAVVAGVAAAFRFGLLDRFLPRSEGHDAEDLLIDAPDQRGNDAKGEAELTTPRRRAPKDFRPDMDAPMTDAEREALRPATGQAPGFAADRGTTVG